MKNQIIIFLLLASAFACSTKKQQEEKNEWKEFDSFHKIIADAYHPMRDSANIEPAKKLAGQMADEAERWVSAPLPEKVNNHEMKASLLKLKADARSLADEINKGAPDGVIKAKLSVLHEQFHKIMEAWQGGRHHEEGEGDEEEEHEDHEEDED